MQNGLELRTLAELIQTCTAFFPFHLINSVFSVFVCSEGAVATLKSFGGASNWTRQLYRNEGGGESKLKNKKNAKNADS